MRKFLLLSVAALLVTLQLWAQRTVTGRVTDDKGTALPNISVQVRGTNTGTVTSTDGTFSLNIPGNQNVLVISGVGFENREVNISGSNSINVTLQTQTGQLSEVVVTGVARGTSTKKLAFSVGKISERVLKEVPAVDAANALRGKVAGVQVVQPTGIPGTAPSIRLRGATNIQQTSNPLIIIDGIITPPGTSLADINMNDVASIEIIKGAAGAALYGSQAANGVVQIISKRGSDGGDRTRITLRNEYGISNLQREFPLKETHRWELNADGSFRLNATGGRIEKANQYYDNPYPVTRNHQQELFENRSFNTLYASIGSSLEKTNFFTSFENLEQNGIVQGVPGFNRKNGRLNVDHNINSKFKISTSMLYSNSKGPDATERQQGGPFYGVLYAEPDSELEALNPDGSRYRAFPNYSGNAMNPLYSIQQTTYDVNRNRFLGNAIAGYDITNWLKLEGQYSIDRTNQFYKQVTQKNTLNQNGTYTGGGLFQQDLKQNGAVYSFTSYLKKDFGDFNTGVTLRYQNEKYTTDFTNASGSRFTVDGVPQLHNLDRTTVNTLTNQTDIRAENYFANVSADYKDKYIFEGLVRRDGSSLFGKEERFQTFYRASAAYRVTEDFKIPGIQEWKLRASYGTSGQRPPFEAQYETFDIVNGVAVKNLLGNANLRPSKVGEFEAGTNFTFLNRFNAEFTYAKSIAKDQILRVPLSPAAGFARQYQNAGTMENKTFEFALGGQIISSKNGFGWNSNLIGSRTISEITELGVPPYASGGLTEAANIAIANSMFRIEAGVPFGVMYGNVLATSLSQITVDKNGFVNNLVGARGLNLKPEDFMINSDGYVIRKLRTNGQSNEGSVDERVFPLFDTTTNQALVAKIGDSNPDFVLGFTNTFTFKNFSFYTLLDAQIGGDVYNATRQLLYFSERSKDLDQSGKPDNQKKAAAYYTAGIGGLYNGNIPVSHFVEDGSFVAIREINLSYNFTPAFMSKLGAAGRIFHDARLSVIGRNLFTFTDYSGYSPEVALANNSTSFRIDMFTYPVFRTYTLALQLRF